MRAVSRLLWTARLHQRDDLAQITDVLGGLTKFEYDADRDLTSVTDGNANQTRYTYDNMDRRISRTGALGAAE